MLEFIDSLTTLLSTSLGLILGCIAGLFVSYVIYHGMIGSDLQVILSAVAFLLPQLWGWLLKLTFLVASNESVA